MKDFKIKKHDTMLAITRELENIDEIRCVNSCLVTNWQQIQFSELVYYPVDVAGYADKAGISILKGMQELRDIIQKYKDYSIKVALDHGYVLVTSLVYDYIYNEEDFTITVQWNKKLIPFISGDMEPGKFIYVDDRMSKVSSKKRYCLYEFLQKHFYKLEKEGSFSISTRILRDVSGTEEGEYKEYKDFNKRVIKPTLEDIYSCLGLRLRAKGNKYSVMFERDKGGRESA